MSLCIPLTSFNRSVQLSGFLGNERQFNAKYSRPIIASRGSGTSANVSRENQEAAALAIEALHRQVKKRHTKGVH
jgi:hypothetical protein